MANCVMNLPVAPCLKGPIAASTRCAIGSALIKSDAMPVMGSVVGEPDRFIVAFCGSGTGHLTQAMKAVEMLQARGLTLAGVVTDTDAAPRMLDEMVKPLGVELLVIPAIELVDSQKGFVPLVEPVRFVSTMMSSQKALHENRHEYAAFFRRARAGQIFNMYHLTLARFFQHNPLPPSMKITHMAAQFGLCDLTEDDTNTLIEVGSKAVMDTMKSIFVASGQTVPISPLGKEGTLPPILHVPTRIEPASTPKLILCYFLVSTNAEMLDAILAQAPMEGVEFHCFTSRALEKTSSQLQSHAKQRKLFQDLFARCTGVIVSAGNETVWEAVCRGVPVLTIPTEGHGEQLLNASVHGRNFPNLVRQQPTLNAKDIRWLVNFDLQDPAAAKECTNLRDLVTNFNEQGSPLLGGVTGSSSEDIVPSAAALKKRVSDLIVSARNMVVG